MFTMNRHTELNHKLMNQIELYRLAGSMKCTPNRLELNLEAVLGSELNNRN
jgi:hypothetical protein